MGARFDFLKFSGRPAPFGPALGRGREVVKPLWSRISPALQLLSVFESAVGRRLRRTKRGGIDIRCTVAVFG
jgi:hypothetical protein